MKIVLLCMLLVLAGCSPSASVRDFPILPDELKDCKFFRLKDAHGNPSITVARCPNSTTTVINGDKHKTTAVVVDGSEGVSK